MLRRRFLMLGAGAVAALSFKGHAFAASLDRFQQFVQTTRSGRGEFEQTVRDRHGKVLQQSRGTLAFFRPGRFRWSYEKPYAQLIVGDGTRVWVYDPDLKQATVRRIGEALTSTPAALLAGSSEAFRSFRFAEGGMRDGLEWLIAIPAEREGGFESVRLGLGVSGVDAMELADNFGNITMLRLRNFERNPALDAALFRFVPPPGTDVIGDGSR